MMRNVRQITIAFLLVASMALMVGCEKKAENTEKPELGKVKAICDLATLECHYHNVARSYKEAGEGIKHWGEKDREFWVEYNGIVKIGIDMNRVNMTQNGNHVTVTLPEAKILSISVDLDSYNQDSIIVSQDALINKNEITAEDINLAVNDAQKKMEEEALSKTQVFGQARERSRELIENYINNIGDLTDTEYEIEWVYEE